MIIIGIRCQHNLILIGNLVVIYLKHLWLLLKLVVFKGFKPN